MEVPNSNNKQLALAMTTNQKEFVQIVGWKILKKPITVGTVVSHSKREERIQMSNEVEQSTQQEETSGNNEGKEVTEEVQWGIAIGAFLIGGIIGAMANPSQPVAGFIVIGIMFAGVALFLVALFTQPEEMKEAWEELKDAWEEAQQQQTSSSSKSKIVCSNCGWKNPEDNNYCHDCGEKLGT